jgi:hypothetical protein
VSSATRDPRAKAGTDAFCNLSGLQMLQLGYAIRKYEQVTVAKPQAPLHHFREA